MEDHDEGDEIAIEVNNWCLDMVLKYCQHIKTYPEPDIPKPMNSHDLNLVLDTWYIEELLDKCDED